uniref:Predicted protein n=1 Tax=Physcomitrium patens TaxID=3218 RepID=A9U4U0_PHYPA
MKEILEENILDAKIEFTLKEVLGIAKKYFHELIIDVIEKKRQKVVEVVMVKASNFYLIKEEDQEIEQIFSQLCAPRFEEVLFEKKKKVITRGYDRSKGQGRARSGKEVEYRIDISKDNFISQLQEWRLKS